MSHSSYETDDDNPGFQRQLSAQDEYALGLWRKHGLGDRPWLEEIEPVATPLLDDPSTILEGASLVLGRWVGASERDLFGQLLVCQNGKKRFGLLLIQCAIEQAQKRQS